MKYHLTIVKMVIIKKSTNNNRWWGYGEKRTVGPCWWDCKQKSTGNNMEGPQKIKNRTTIWPRKSTAGYTSRKNKNTNSKRYMHPKIHSSTIYTWKEPIRQVDLKTFCMAHGILTKNVILPFVTMWMGLENTMFSEISQRKEILYDITYIQSEKQNKKMYIAKGKQTHR